MENSLLVTLSRQISLQHKMNTIANNLANMNTAGYKSEGLKFEEYLMPVAQVNSFQGSDRNVTFVDDPKMVRDFSEGAFRQTGNALDIALSGKGFMVVDTPQGQRYTRNGQLQLNNEGTLVTNEGHPVLGDGGPITFGSQETGITISKDGTISSSAGIKGSLQVVEFENRASLKKEGETMFSSTQTPAAAENTKVIQGSFETSNVRAMLELTQMIETVRAYSGASKILTTNDETRGKAIQQLGKLES